MVDVVLLVYTNNFRWTCGPGRVGLIQRSAATWHFLCSSSKLGELWQ